VDLVLLFDTKVKDDKKLKEQLGEQGEWELIQELLSE
jgi:hypothetical protein